MVEIEFSAKDRERIRSHSFFGDRLRNYSDRIMDEAEKVANEQLAQAEPRGCPIPGACAALHPSPVLSPELTDEALGRAIMSAYDSSIAYSSLDMNDKIKLVFNIYGQKARKLIGQEITRLQEENFALAAHQCHTSYGDEGGSQRCQEVDDWRKRAELAEAKLAALQEKISTVSEKQIYENSAGKAVEMLVGKIGALIRIAEAEIEVNDPAKNSDDLVEKMAVQMAFFRLGRPWSDTGSMEQQNARIAASNSPPGRKS